MQSRWPHTHTKRNFILCPVECWVCIRIEIGKCHLMPKVQIESSTSSNSSRIRILPATHGVTKCDAKKKQITKQPKYSDWVSASAGGDTNNTSHENDESEFHVTHTATQQSNLSRNCSKCGEIENKSTTKPTNDKNNEGKCCGYANHDLVQ